MSSIAVIYEAVVNVLRVCNKCCKENKKDKEDEEAEEEEEEKSEDKAEAKESETEGSDSEKAKTKSTEKPKTTKTRKKKNKVYSAVKQAEPTTTQPQAQPTFQNHFNPVFTIINSPYSSAQPNLPAVQAEQAASGATPEPSIVEWVPSSLTTAGYLANRAVVGGYDIDESDLWIIRVRILDDLIPGKLNQEFGLAFVVTKKKDTYVEKNVENFEVCCIAPHLSHRIRWVESSDGNVPKHAVPGGRKCSGEKVETLYIGRHIQKDENREHLHSLCPGLIQPSHGVLYITYDFKVYSYKSYEVLCIE